MAYNKTNWVTGDVITAQKLNNIEDGIVNANVKPDWNVNDSNADDYIKNRPFYKGEENIITLIPETTITATEEGANLRIEDGGAVFNIAKDNVGKIVKIQYNDVIEYGVITFNDVGDESSCAIASSTVYISVDNVSYNVAIYNFDAANAIFHATIDNTEIKKISSDYLPIPTIEGKGFNSIILNGFQSGCNADGNFAVAEGDNTTVSGFYSHAEGQNTTVSGWYSHAEGQSTKASGEFSHAEGQSTTANGMYSHAEGQGTGAGGGWSHAEGHNSSASEDSSHAEGYHTHAWGKYSHAEGYQTEARGQCSHTEGNETCTKHKSQHVFGEFNIIDPSSNGVNARGNYVEIVGNGTSTFARTNARTLDWSGNEWLAGNLTAAGGTITIGLTSVTEAQLQQLLGLLNS